MSRTIRGPLLAQLRAIEPDPDVTFSQSGFCVRSSAGPSYYVKTGSPSETEQYQGGVKSYQNVSWFIDNSTGEAESLKEIEAAAPGLAPKVYKFGFLANKEEEEGDEDAKREHPFMISEYKFLQPLSGRQSLELAKRLALELHAYKSDQSIYNFYQGRVLD
jgi:protein-ribulosamine 3-kinase